MNWFRYIVIAVALAVPAVAQSPEVTLFRADAGRTGQFVGPAVRELSGERWEFRLGTIATAAPVYADGTVYLASARGRLVAIDAESGQQRWTFRAKPATQVFSSVAVVGDAVYIGTDRNRVFAVDRETGRRRWKLKTNGAVWTAPLVRDGVLYFASLTGAFYAANAETGAVRWRVETGERSTWPPLAAAGLVVFPGEDSLIAVDPATGAERWRLHRDYWHGPSSDGTLVYAGNADGRLYAVNAADGRVAWTTDSIGSRWTAPAIVDATLWIGNGDGNLYAIDAATGSVAYAFHVPEDEIVGDPIVADGVIYFGEGNHNNRRGPRHLYAFDITSREILWSYQTDDIISVAPAIGGGAVYVGTVSGRLTALE